MDKNKSGRRGADSPLLVHQAGSVAESETVRRIYRAIQRIVSDASSILITAKDGHVSLSGFVHAEKAQPLLREVAQVKGVNAVENHLTVYQRSEETRDVSGQPRQ